MSRFEFVSFNENAHEKSVCFGDLVFKYDGQTHKTVSWLFNAHNGLEICQLPMWSVEDIVWSHIPVEIPDADKQAFLKMIIDHVQPLTAKCGLCFRELTDEEVKASITPRRDERLSDEDYEAERKLMEGPDGYDYLERWLKRRSAKFSNAVH